MNDTSDTLSAIASQAEREIARLAQLGDVNARAELQLRVWPTLLDLVEVVSELAGDDPEPPSVPVDLVARAVGTILGLVQLLGKPVAEAQLQEIGVRTREVIEELIGLVDADELAAYCSEVTQESQGQAAPPVIDTTAVEAAPAAAAPAAAPTVAPSTTEAWQ